MAIFNGQRTGECLDQFCERRVRPPEPELEGLKRTVNSFVRFLHKEFPEGYSVQKVYKSGSLKKGTAIRESADVDLVVYVNEITNIHQLIKARPFMLEQLKKNIDSYGPWKGRIQFQQKTLYSLQYKLDGYEVDLLPAFDALKCYGTSENIYEVMKRDSEKLGFHETGQEYSASLSKLQVKFVKPVEGYVKDVIRLLKRWKMDKDLDLRSYTLELLTIRAWRYFGKSNVGTPLIFREVMKMLSNHDSLSVSFDDYYDNKKYLRHYSKPYLLDPANPFKNVLDRTSRKSWEKIVQEAKEALTKA